MRPVYYFRTTREDVRKAYAADAMEVARIETICGRFAAQFGAKPAFTVGFDSHFAGVMFDKEHPCKYPELWSQPTDKHPLQVPRSPERAGSKLRETANSIYTLYHSTFPAECAQPRISQVVATLGLLEADPTQLLLVYVEVGNTVYIACSQALAGLDEIVASEFLKAEKFANSPITVPTDVEIVGQLMKDAANGNIH